MASCSQYSAAFGYQVFIVPVSACGVDLESVTGGVTAGGFIDPSSPLAANSKILEGATSANILAGDPGSDIVYDNDVVTSETTLKLLGLTNAALETDTSSETVTTYDTESKGFDQNVATSKSWSISLEGVSQFGDAGYKTLRLLEQNAVAGALKLKIGRIGPTGTVEAVYGYATLTNFSESIEAGSIVSWSCTAEGYGPYALDLDNGNSPNLVGPIATYTLTQPGADLADGTYTDEPLVGGAGSGATATITVSGGVASIDSLSGGDLYEVGDTLSPALPTGPGVPGTGEVLTLDPSFTGGTGFDVADGSIDNITTTTNGSGSGAEVRVNFSGGDATTFILQEGGQDYAVGDEIYVTAANAGGTTGTDMVLTVTAVDEGTPASPQEPIITVDSIS